MDPANTLQSSMHMCLRPYGTFWHEAVEPRIYPGDMNDNGVHVLITWPTGQSTEDMVCSFGFVYSGVQATSFFSFFSLWWAYSVQMCDGSRADRLLQNQWNLSVETTFKVLNLRLPLENGSIFPFWSFWGFLGYWSRLVHIIRLQTNMI